MVLQGSWITCWCFVLVHLLCLDGETNGAVNIIRDGWPNGPLAATGKNSALILMQNTRILVIDSKFYFIL